MKTSITNTDSKTDSLPKPEIQTTEVVTPAPVENSDVDDFGYEVEPAPVAPKELPKPDAVVPPAEEVKPLTGYGKDTEEVKPPEVVTPPAEEVKPEELTEEQKLQKEISEAVKELGDGFNKEKIAKFALENKLSKTQVEAYVKFAKSEEKEILKAQEEATKAQRKSWGEELMKDPEFGGENFEKNVDRVEKVLKNYMPNTKKILTERGSMLPPYIMRDFLSLDKLLNPTTPLVSGEPSVPAENDSNFLDDMYN